MKTEVLCIGQAVVDCIVRGQEDAPGKLARTAESITLSIGGDAVNEATALRQKGHGAAAMIAVGEDAAGQLLLTALEKQQVELSYVSVMPAPFMTPVAHLIVDKEGRRTSVNSPATLLPAYVPALPKEATFKVVSLASLFRAPLDNPKTLCALAKDAKAAGAILCADTKLPTFRHLSLDDLGEVLPRIDYLFPNEKEAAFYTGKESFEEMADVFLSRGVKHVVIKAGAEGCFAKNASTTFQLPAIPVDVVDTTGAGDHFVAGFITGLLENKDFESCCREGLIYAAESIQQLGGVMTS